MSQKEENGKDNVLDNKIENIVATVSVQIEEKIDLKLIAQKCAGVEYNPERFPGLIMRVEKPRATVLVFSTGKMVITGIKDSEEVTNVVEKVIKNINNIGIKITKPLIKVQNILDNSI